MITSNLSQQEPKSRAFSPRLQALNPANVWRISLHVHAGAKKDDVVEMIHQSMHKPQEIHTFFV